MALSDIVMALLSSQPAEAAGLSAAKAAVRVPTKPAPKAKGKPAAPAPPEVRGISGITAMPEVYIPKQNIYEAIGLPPIYQNIGEAITQGNATLADIIAKNPQLANDPRFTAQVKFSEQGIIPPVAIGAASKLVEEAPLPGIAAMRAREAEMKDYIDFMKQKEAGLAKNAWMYTDLSPAANLLQNITGTNIGYKAPVNPLDKATQTRLAFEKELSDLMERRGGIERQFMHEILGQPTTVSQGYAQERPVRAPAGKKLPDNRKFIYQQMTGMSDTKKLIDTLQEYKGMIAAKAPIKVLLDKYTAIQALIKNAEKMGGALTPQESEISFSKLPHPAGIEIGPFTGKKSERIDDLISTYSSEMQKKINSLHSTYPESSSLINDLTKEYNPKVNVTTGPVQKRAVQGGTGIDFNEFKGK